MAEIVITEFMDEASVDVLRARFSVEYDPQMLDRASQTSGGPSQMFAKLSQSRAMIVRNRTRVTPELLAHAPHLTCVGRLGVGLDNIDLPACAARGIQVFPATGANDVAVAEYVIASAMLLLRGAYGASNAVASGQWPRNALMGREIFGKTLGLVGFGAIARETAVRAKVMGMDIIAFDPFVAAGDAVLAQYGVQKVELDQLLGEADVISLHVPLTQSTRNILNAAALAKMKPGAILINAARGGVVDEAALADALRSAKIGGAALDVFDVEPLSADRGKIFADCKNLILTPHIAGVTVESNTRVSALIARLVIEHLAAHP